MASTSGSAVPGHFMKHRQRRTTWISAVVAGFTLLAGCSEEPADNRRLAEFLALCERPEATQPATPPPEGQPESPLSPVDVSSTDELRTALAESRAGQRIFVAAGTYEGPFDITTSGTQEQPIVLCATPGATIAGTSSDYALHIEGAAWWSIQGLAIVDSKKGVVLDETNHSSLVALDVSGIDQEAVHLRTNSSDNTVIGLRVSDTGRTDPQFGEGIYVGSAVSNWCRYTNCSPDRSDRNRIIGNTFGSDVRAENIDIKEGTTGGEISGNRLSGRGTTADSWIDLKGNEWLVTANVGALTREDGMAVRVEAEGWGNDNRITSNDMTIDAPGYGVWVDRDAEGTIVGCDNEARGAGSGLSNIVCTP